MNNTPTQLQIEVHNFQWQVESAIAEINCYGPEQGLLWIRPLRKTIERIEALL